MSAKTPVGVLALLFALLTTTLAAGATSGDVGPSPAERQPALGAVEAADSETAVHVPDAVLREAVEQALGKEADEPITRGDMATLRRLEAQGVRQLTGIEHAVNLDLLGATDGTVSDLAPLSGLTSLRELWLYDNGGTGRISDVGPLAGLNSLETLLLTGNRITDLAPLSGLRSLTRLGVGNNPVTDLTPLSGLTSLTRLNLWRCPVSDLTPLSNLRSLSNLELYGTEVSDLTPLSNLRSLSVLSLGGTEISDLTPLSNLRSLASLTLRDTGILDLTPLARLTSLRWLTLNNNSISDLTELSDLTSLFGLALERNRIEDLGPLSSLTNLERLNLIRNHVRDVAPLAGLTSLRGLWLRNNYIVDVEPLARNTGLGDGDYLNLKGNSLSAKSLETDIPTLLQRGVEVLFDDPARDGAELFATIADPALAAAVVEALANYLNYSGNFYHVRDPYTVDDLASLGVLDASNRRIEVLDGLDELATGLQRLRRLDLRGNFISDLSPLAGLAGRHASAVYGVTTLRYLHLGGNDISDIGPLAGLDLFLLSLDDNAIEDFAPLADMTSLRSLALDGNSIRNLPTLPDSLAYLYLTDNSISDLSPLANLGLVELQLSDNQVTDITSLRFGALEELHLRNNAVQDISPLLRADRLAMVDVRGNPLSGEALSVLGSLRESGVTVLAGEAVPYFPAAGTPGREGFVRIVNRSNRDGEVFVEAVDDAGVRVGPVRIGVGARRAVHFRSRDLENGNAAKGLDAGVGPPTTGAWRLEVTSPLDIEVLSYVRTDDGFVTAMHDVATQAMLPFFNPGSNESQRSILRVVNTEAERAKWMTGGYDDRGEWRPMAGTIEVQPGHALRLTAEALEDDHGLGDGSGKWRLRARGFPWFAMSLLDSAAGPLANLSTAPNHAEPLADGRTMRRVPLLLTAGEFGEGFLRVINRSAVPGEVAIEAVDDEGGRFGPVRLIIGARQTAHFRSRDLEAGNTDKGLSGGIGSGEGDWRLELTSELDLLVLSYVRTGDGFLTSTHDLAPLAADGSHRVVFFNPGRNTGQVSRLRLINNGDRPASATITGIDDAGSDSGTVTLTVPAASALAFTSKDLEQGEGPRAGGLGEGSGKWRLRVSSDVPLGVMSLLENRRTGHLANVSTGTED